MTVEDLIRRHEGCSLVPYLDSRGVRTVGIGHSLVANPLPSAIYPLAQEDVDDIFAQDLSDAEAPLKEKFEWFTILDPVRQAVLIDMSFQLGWPGLLSFEAFLGLMSRGEFGPAADDLMGTLLARQTPVRVSENAEMLRSGCWPDQNA